jgi:hypothetical protein
MGWTLSGRGMHGMGDVNDEMNATIPLTTISSDIHDRRQPATMS